MTSYLGKNVATNLQNGDIHLAKITDFGVGYPWDDISRAIGALRSVISHFFVFSVHFHLSLTFFSWSFLLKIVEPG